MSKYLQNMHAGNMWHVVWSLQRAKVGSNGSKGSIQSDCHREGWESGAMHISVNNQKLLNSLDVLDGKQFLKLLNLSTTVPIKNAEDFLL